MMGTGVLDRLVVSLLCSLLVSGTSDRRLELLTRTRGQLGRWGVVGELTGMQEPKMRLKRLGFFGLLPWSVRSPVSSILPHCHHQLRYLPLSIMNDE